MVKLYDSEIKVMDILWEHGNMKATEIVQEMKKRDSWNKNTTYTVINKCIKKGAIQREEPNFLCIPIIEKSDVQKYETNQLIKKIFGGSNIKFLSHFLAQDNFAEKELAEIEELIKKHKSGDL